MEIDRRTMPVPFFSQRCTETVILSGSLHVHSFSVFEPFFFQAASFHGDRSTNKCQSPSFLKDVQRQSFLVVRFARAFSGRRTWEIRAFKKDGLANSQLLTSLRVRGRPLWEFACLVGSSGALLARLREFTDLSTLHEYSLLVVRVHFWVSFPWASFWPVQG